MGNPGFNLGERGDVHKQGGQVDLPRMEEGGLDAIFFAVFLSQGELSPEGHKRAMDNAIKTPHRNLFPEAPTNLRIGGGRLHFSLPQV